MGLPFGHLGPELAHHGPEDILISTATIIGALVIMFNIEWRLAAVIAVIVPIFVVIVMLCRKNFMDSSANVKKKLADINADIEVTTKAGFALSQHNRTRPSAECGLSKGEKGFSLSAARPSKAAIAETNRGSR